MKYNRLTRVILILAAVFTSRCIAETDVLPTVTINDLTNVLGEINTRFETFSSMQYDVVKESKGESQSVSEKYSFIYQNPSFFRVEYSEPDARLLVLNTEHLTEYIPAAGKALQTSLQKMKGSKRRGFIAGIFSRVSVEGLRVGNAGELLKSVASVEPSTENPNGWVLHGTKPRFSIEVDLKKKVLTHTEIWDDKGGLVVRTHASKFIEVHPDCWFPQYIQATYPAAEAFLETSVTLKNIQINEAITPDTFVFEKPRGVEIIKP